MKYLIYTRVSERGSDWSGETSCEAQSQECRRYVLAMNPRAEFEEIREEFLSGTSLKKRKLGHVLNDAADGRAEWDVLVALDLDRLFRSTEECLASFRHLSEAKKGVILVRQNIDLASPYGQFTLTVLAAVAQLTAQIGSTKTRDKMLYIARQGLWPGKAPLGYRRPAPRVNKLEPDPGTADMVRAMFRAAADGKGPVGIAREHGLPVNTVNKLLASKFYLGRLIYAEIDVAGQHEAIIDAATWHAAQRVATVSTPRPTRQAYPYKLTGLVRCGCGHAMSPATCNGKGGRYPYYRCQNAACKEAIRYVRADQLEVALLQEVASYCYSDGACARLAEYEARHHAAIMAAESPELQRLSSSLQDARADVDRLLASLDVTKGGGMENAFRAILTALDGRQRDMERIERELVSMRERLAAHAQAQDPSSLAGMWQETARRLAAGDGDARAQADWIRAHVRGVVSDGGGWAVTFAVTEGSTSRTLKHPQGAAVEIRIRLPKIVKIVRAA